MKNLILNYGENRIESVGKIVDYIETAYVNGEAFRINHEKQTLTSATVRDNTQKSSQDNIDRIAQLINMALRHDLKIIINYVIDENEIHLYNFHITDVDSNLLFSL